MDPLDFLGALFETAAPGSGVVELRGLKNAGGFDARLFTDEPGEMRRFLGRYRENYPAGAYFGVALRTGKPHDDGKVTGKKNDISVVTALWADIDVIKMGWDMDRTIGLIKAHELRPSALVNSGNGLHAYWVLDRPMDLVEADNDGAWFDAVETVEETMQQLAAVFGGDNTSDITRVLRVPGTWNTKGDKPKPVKVVFADWQEYDLADLAKRATTTDRLLDKEGWLSRDQMKAKLKAAREAAGEVLFAGALLHEAGLQHRKLSWQQIWQLARYGGAERGTAFIGLDEAMTRGTAYLYAHKPTMSDDEIIESVLFEIKQIKARQAPKERWDAAAEYKKAKDKLDRFKDKWRNMVDERGKSSGKRKRG